MPIRPTRRTKISRPETVGCIDEKKRKKKEEMHEARRDHSSLVECAKDTDRPPELIRVRAPAKFTTSVINRKSHLNARAPRSHLHSKCRHNKRLICGNRCTFVLHRGQIRQFSATRLRLVGACLEFLVENIKGAPRPIRHGVRTMSVLEAIGDIRRIFLEYTYLMNIL